MNSQWFFIKTGSEPARYINLDAVDSFQFFPKGEQRPYLEIVLRNGEKITVFGKAEEYFNLLLSMIEPDGFEGDE